MRSTVLVSALCLGACGWLAACNPDNGGFFGTPGGDFCQQDSDCSGGDVCARSGQCFAADDVRSIAVVWTVDGQPASEDSCGAHKSFTLQFFADGGYSFGYQPVPCKAGKFTVDKMPKIINFVEMFDTSSGNSGGTGPIVDASNEAALDLSLDSALAPSLDH